MCVVPLFLVLFMVLCDIDELHLFERTSLVEDIKDKSQRTEKIFIINVHFEVF